MCLSFSAFASGHSPRQSLLSEGTFRTSRSRPGEARQGNAAGKISHQWVTIGGYRLAAGRLKEVLVGQKTKKGFRYLGTARVSAAPGLRKRLSSHLRMLHIYDCPFAAGTDSLPAGLTEEQMEECVWVEPSVKAWVENLPSKGPGLCALPTVMKFTE